MALPVRTLAALVCALTVSACSSPGGDATASRPVSPSATPPAPASAQPGGEPSWVVTVGDSYISGEGARWAGNTSGGSAAVDALGPDAYVDTPQGEAEPACHRARESVADLGGGLRGLNLGCSGATTRSSTEGGRFTPGVDFAEAAGHTGQALALQRFARSHRISAVVVSIGGNDFGFGTVVGACLRDFVTTIGSRPANCRDDQAVDDLFGAGRAQRVAADIAAALRRVAAAMSDAGYGAGDYRVVVQNYPSPLPPGPRIRYQENQLERSFVGGCPLYDVDATWANSTVLRAINEAVASAVQRAGLGNVTLLDLTHAFDGHRLCERGVGLLTATTLRSWREPQAVNELEWVNAAYAKGPPWQVQESLHPNYWGTLAERACLRLVLGTDGRDSVACVPGGRGLSAGEPQMALSP